VYSFVCKLLSYSDTPAREAWSPWTTWLNQTMK